MEKKSFRLFIVLCVCVFSGFLTIGIPLAVLPGIVHDTLGFSAFIVGAVMGLQSAATVLTRKLAGNSADTRGARETVRQGLIICTVAGVVYLISTFTLGIPYLSLTLLVVGRLILGLGESLLITGALTWGIGLVGAKNSGKVMAWNGIAMYGALALGAPMGLWLNEKFGPNSVMIVSILFPAVAFALSTIIPPVQTENVLDEREPFLRIVKLIWPFGFVMGLGTIGFGALSTFIVLFFQSKGFGDAGLALLIFGGCYVAVRLVAGHLPDLTGGGVIAIISLFVEAIGQAFIWLAPNASIAYVGAALTGAGFSLVFPSLGIQATKRVPAHSRGAALGAFFAFFDIALGVAAPVCGAVSSLVSYPAVYLFGAMACALAGFVSIGLHLNRRER